MKFINDKNIELNLPNHKFSDRMMEWSKSEKHLRLLINEMLDSKIIEGNIIDLGAYVGDNAIPWAFNNKNIMIYAIDPSPDNCHYINLFAAENSITNIKIICKAISEMNQVISTNGNLNHCSFINNNTGKNKVDSISLDYLYSQKEIKDIGLLHLDVEGMEFNVIKGASILIGKFEPVIIFEQHIRSEPYKKICEHLSNKFNYTNYMIPEVCGCRNDCRNFLSVPSHKVNSLQHLEYTNTLIKQR
jgi:FkbM family methyltransferase